MKSINKYRLIFKFFCIIFIFLLLIFIYNCVKFVFIGYDYTINSDVTVTLTNKYHSSELVEVPSRIWFIDVKKLGKHKTGRDLWGTKTKGIFDCDDTITDLILSEGIEEIEGGAIINPNYSRISGIAYENGYVRENSSKTDTLQSFPPKKGALLPWGSDNF